MSGFSRVYLAGNLTRDPELSYTPKGTAVARFAVAINEAYESGGEKHERTHFVDVTAWAKTAEVVAKQLAKGSPVYIEGSLDYQAWEHNGQKRSALRVKAFRVMHAYLDGKEGGHARPQGGGDDSEAPF